MCIIPYPWAVTILLNSGPVDPESTKCTNLLHSLPTSISFKQGEGTFFVSGKVVVILYSALWQVGSDDHLSIPIHAMGRNNGLVCQGKQGVHCTHGSHRSRLGVGGNGIEFPCSKLGV